MNSKITLPELVSLLAERTGFTKRQCEAFIKAVFANVSSSLVHHENVKIKGFGTFKLTEIDSRKSVDVNTGREIEIAGHYRVSFVADKALAELLNKPFELFESVEISDDVSDEMLEAADMESGSDVSVSQPLIEDETDWNPKPDETPTLADSDITDDNVAPTYYNVEEAYSETEPADTDYEYQLEEPVEEPEEESENIVEEEDDFEVQEAEAEDEPEEVKPAVNSIADVPTKQPFPDKDIHTHTPKKSYSFGWGFLSGLLACCVIAAIVCVVWYYYNKGNTAVEVAQTEVTITNDSLTTDTLPEDSVATPPKDTTRVAVAEVVEVQQAEQADDKGNEVNTKPSDTPVYDTISKTRYLTTMAKAHYGNYHLWPYIYEANKGLGHPDRIRPGTKVVIPDIAKLGINPKDPKAIAEAKRKGTAIYARYAHK